MRIRKSLACGGSFLWVFLTLATLLSSSPVIAVNGPCHRLWDSLSKVNPFAPPRIAKQADSFFPVSSERPSPADGLGFYRITTKIRSLDVVEHSEVSVASVKVGKGEETADPNAILVTDQRPAIIGRNDAGVPRGMDEVLYKEYKSQSLNRQPFESMNPARLHLSRAQISLHVEVNLYSNLPHLVVRSGFAGFQPKNDTLVLSPARPDGVPLTVLHLAPGESCTLLLPNQETIEIEASEIVRPPH